MRLKCYFAVMIFASLAVAQSASQQISPDGEGGDIINEDMLERKQEAILRQDFQQRFFPWVLEQIDSIKSNSQFQSIQSFLLQIASNHVHEFRWPPKAKEKNLRLKIRVFTHENGDDIVILKNPEEESRVQVSYRTSFNDQPTLLANVYLQKIVKVTTNGEGAFIQLRNTHDTKVIVEVSVEGDPERLNPDLIAKNDHFKVPTVKMEAMLGEMKTTESNRKRQYKWEWGFLQREEHYEQEMLKLVGGQTIIILATAIVQMYCIKALLQNTNVV